VIIRTNALYQWSEKLGHDQEGQLCNSSDSVEGCPSMANLEKEFIPAILNCVLNSDRCAWVDEIKDEEGDLLRHLLALYPYTELATQFCHLPN